MDSSKAFDTLKHTTLSRKIRIAGIYPKQVWFVFKLSVPCVVLGICVRYQVLIPVGGGGGGGG